MISANAAAAAAGKTPTNHLSAEQFQKSADLFVHSGRIWLLDNWLEILIATGVAVGVAFLLFALRSWVLNWSKKHASSTGWRLILGHAVARTGNWFIILLAAELVTDYASPPAAIARTVQFLFTVLMVFQAAVWAREIILGVIERRTASDSYHGETLGTAMGIIRLLVTIGLFAIALIVVLDNLGVNVTGLVAGLGVGGIAIGLAAQGIFADLFAALSIIFDKPFRKGDAIAYGDTAGAVEAIGLKSTRIRALTGEERIIANRNLLDKEIINNTQRIHRRQAWTLGVIYQTPPEVCSAIPDKLKEIVEAHDAIFVRCGFVGFGGSSLDFELQFDTDGPDYATFYETRTAIGIAILKMFNDEGIEFAYPTQTTFAADPDSGKAIMPYPQVQPVRQIQD